MLHESSDADHSIDASPYVRYESINTVTKPHSKKQSQLPGTSSITVGAQGHPSKSCPDGEQQTGASEQQARDHSDRGQTTAENARYGEAFSEHGFGGETTTNSAQSGREGTKKQSLFVRCL